MKTCSTIATRCSALRRLRLHFVFLPALVLPAFAQLRLLPDREPQQLFGGSTRPISVRWQNPGTSPVTSQLRTRLLQASSATIAPLGDWSWKKLEVLPGQTVIESARLGFPAVNAETRCLVQWIVDTNTVLGTTEVLVYPTNLLAELRPLAGEQPIGLFDPQNQLKPLLNPLGVEFADLEETGVAGFAGKLAIIGPFPSNEQMREDLPLRIKTAAGKGAGIVWIQPPPGRHEPLKPSFQVVPEGKGVIVVAQPHLITNLAEDPQSQLNLLHLARLASQPRSAGFNLQQRPTGIPLPFSSTPSPQYGSRHASFDLQRIRSTSSYHFPALPLNLQFSIYNFQFSIPHLTLTSIHL